MVTVMNACVGSWKCGKSRAFTTFPQPLLLFVGDEFPEKFPIQGGKETQAPPSPPLEAILKALPGRI